MAPRGIHQRGGFDSCWLHTDTVTSINGKTLLTTLQVLGAVPSFSRPWIAEDNHFFEVVLHTLKYRPRFSEGRLSSLVAVSVKVDVACNV